MHGENMKKKKLLTVAQRVVRCGHGRILSDSLRRSTWRCVRRRANNSAWCEISGYYSSTEEDCGIICIMVDKYQHLGGASFLHFRKYPRKGALFFDYPQDGGEELFPNVAVHSVCRLKLNPLIAASLHSVRRRPLCSTACIPVYTSSYNSFQTVTKKWIAIGKSRVPVKVIRTEVLRGFTQSFQALIEIRPQLLPNTGFLTN
jgi:hypothetical protein